MSRKHFGHNVRRAADIGHEIVDLQHELGVVPIRLQDIEEHTAGSLGLGTARPWPRARQRTDDSSHQLIIDMLQHTEISIRAHEPLVVHQRVQHFRHAEAAVKWAKGESSVKP